MLRSQWRTTLGVCCGTRLGELGWPLLMRGRAGGFEWKSKVISPTKPTWYAASLHLLSSSWNILASGTQLIRFIVVHLSWAPCKCWQTNPNLFPLNSYQPIFKNLVLKWIQSKRQNIQQLLNLPSGLSARLKLNGYLFQLYLQNEDLNCKTFKNSLCIFKHTESNWQSRKEHELEMHLRDISC